MCAVPCFSFIFLFSLFFQSFLAEQLRDLVNDMERIVGFVGDRRDEDKKLIPNRVEEKDIEGVKRSESALGGNQTVSSLEYRYIETWSFDRSEYEMYRKSKLTGPSTGPWFGLGTLSGGNSVTPGLHGIIWMVSGHHGTQRYCLCGIRPPRYCTVIVCVGSGHHSSSRYSVVQDLAAAVLPSRDGATSRVKGIVCAGSGYRGTQRDCFVPDAATTLF